MTTSQKADEYRKAHIALTAQLLPTAVAVLTPRAPANVDVTAPEFRAECMKLAAGYADDVLAMMGDPPDELRNIGLGRSSKSPI